MKFSIAVLMLCAFQSSVVLGRTIDEVIEDFQPLILELHNIVGKETNHLAKEDGQYYIAIFGVNLAGLKQSLNNRLRWLEQTINIKVNEIVAETGMISHKDQIQHCFAQKDTNILRLLQDASAGEAVCSQLAGIDLDNLSTILNDYKNMQYPMHNALEESVHTCKRNSENGSDMQTCLVEHIIIQVAPQLGQTLKDIKTNITGLSSIVAGRQQRTATCFNVVGGKVDTTVDSVTKGFRECCIAASQNN